MPLDSSIPLQSVAPDPMASLSSLLDVGTKSLSLQKHRATFDADVARSKADSSTAQSAATVNAANVNPLIRQQAAQTSSAVSKSQVDSANVRPLIDQQAAQTSTAQTGASGAAFDLRTKQRDSARQFMSAMLTDKNLNDLSGNYNSKKAVQTLRTMREFALENGNDPHTVETTMAKYIGAASSAGGVINALKGDILAQSNPNNIPSAVNPSIKQTQSGNTIHSRDENSFSPTYSSDAMNPVTMQPPPTTPTMGGPNGTTPGIMGPAGPGQSGLGGPPQTMAPTRPGSEAQQLQRSAFGANAMNNPNAAANEIASIKRDLTKPLDPASRAMLTQQLQELQATQHATPQAGNNPTTGFMPTGLPEGRKDSIAATQKGVNDHYRSLQDGAANAAQDIGVLQNIISHAHGASTGIGSDKLAISQAIFGKLGIDSAKASTLDYDLLGKNAAMIQLAGGDTNLAKTLAGAANPNSHMSEEAIRQAAHQIIGQKKMALQGLKLFTPLKALSDGGHMEAYNSMMPKYLEAADPRIMQLPNMSDEEKAKMKSAMSPTEQKAFSAKIRALKTFGIEP